MNLGPQTPITPFASHRFVLARIAPVDTPGPGSGAGPVAPHLRHVSGTWKKISVSAVGEEMVAGSAMVFKGLLNGEQNARPPPTQTPKTATAER